MSNQRKLGVEGYRAGWEARNRSGVGMREFFEKVSGKKDTKVVHTTGNALRKGKRNITRISRGVTEGKGG